MLYNSKFKVDEPILVKISTNNWEKCYYKGKAGHNGFYVATNPNSSYVELSYNNCEIAPYIYENIELIGTKRQTYKERFKKYMNKYNLKSGDLVEVYVCDDNSLTCCPKTAFSNPDITNRVNTLRNTLDEVKSVGKVVEISIDGIIYVDLRSISSNKTFSIPFPYTCVKKLIFNPNKPFTRGDNAKIFKYEDETGYILPEVAKYRENNFVVSNKTNYNHRLFEKDPYFTRKCNSNDTSFNASLSIRGHLFFNSDDVTVTIDNDKVCIVDNSTAFTLIAKKNDTPPCRIKDIILVSNDKKDWILGTLSSKNYTSSEKWIYKIKGNNNTFNYCIHYKGNEDKLHG